MRVAAPESADSEHYKVFIEPPPTRDDARPMLGPGQALRVHNRQEALALADRFGIRHEHIEWPGGGLGSTDG